MKSVIKGHIDSRIDSNINDNSEDINIDTYDNENYIQLKELERRAKQVLKEVNIELSLLSDNDYCGYPSKTVYGWVIYNRY